MAVSNALDPVLLRRILGTASLVLVLGIGTLILDWRYSPPTGSYQVVAELGKAGSGVSKGTDVKVRGVNVGRVDRVRYEDGTAYADLTLYPHPPLPAAEHLDLVVTQKTLLGEKQLELSFPQEAFEQPPFLADGDTIVASREPTELSEVLDRFEPFLAAIDERELATIVEVLGAQRGEGELIAENLDVGQQLAAFADRTSDDSLARLSDFALVAEALEGAAPDMTRLNRTLPDATGLLVERQEDLRTNLLAVSRFATTLGRFVETEGPVISRFLRTSQPVGDVLERQQDEIGNLVEGIALYMESLGRGGMLLDDGSEWAGFRIFIDQDSFDPVKFLCHEFDEVLGAEPPALCEGGHG
jgi:phospholipid/cholesterol/gamma-HCH transport system substrate-binding protein